MSENIINKIKKNWKGYSNYLATAVIFLVIGMTATEVETLKQILINTISGLITQLPWFILLYIGFKIIGKSITDLGKKIPEFLDQYERIKFKTLRVERARGLG